MEFLVGPAAPQPSANLRLGVLSGSFHPVTRAHLALAGAALAGGRVDQVLFVMPREFPHKRYEGVGLEDRIDLVRQAAAVDPRFLVAISEGGLFIEIAREARPHFGYGCDLWFLCGRDAAERIVEWDYGAEDRFSEQLNEFGLLVAARSGRAYQPPDEFASRILPLEMGPEWRDVSASEVRARIRAGGAAWSHLVPESVVAGVERLYR